METIVCPYCNGSGCPNCQSSGQLQVSQEELQQLQALMPAPGSAQTMPNFVPPQAMPQTQANSLQKTLPGSRITFREIKTKTAGLIAFLLLLSLFLGAYFSNRFFNSYQPYLASVLSVLLLALNGLTLKSKFFQYQNPDDFIAAIDKLSLQKRSS